MAEAKLKLPCDIQAEKLVLGSILLDGRKYQAAAGVTIDDFSLEIHRTIWGRMSGLHEREEHIDRVTVATELDRHRELESVGGLGYLTELDDGLPELPNLGSYTRILREKATLRKIIYTSQEMRNRALADEESSAILYDASQRLTHLDVESHSSESYPNPLQIMESHEGGVPGFMASSQKPGIKTMYPSLDEITLGLREGAYYVIGGITSSGKSSLGLGIAQNLAKQAHGVLYMSPEMTSSQLLMRMISAEAEVPLKAIVKGNLFQDQRIALSKATSRVAHLPIYFDDASSLTIPDMLSKIARAKLERNIQLAVVDYLQILDWQYRPGSPIKLDNEYNAMTYASRSLKMAAKRHGIRVIAVSQLSRRKTVKGADSRPGMSDLKGSGGIENDADCIILVHRPEQLTPGKEDLREKAELIIAKHRLGETGTVHVRFQSRFTKFIDDGPPLPHSSGAEED